MYRTIDSEMWDDPKIRRLDASTKVVLLYLLTSRHTHVTGLYFFSRALASDDLNMPLQHVNRSFKKLCDVGFCQYDEANRVVFVVNFWKRQPHVGVHLDRLQLYFKSLHGTPLVSAFLTKYPDLKRHVTDPSLFCHQSEPDCHESALHKIEQEIEQKQDKSTSPVGEPAHEKSDNSKIYDSFIEKRREAIQVVDWKPTDTQAKAMRAVINKLLKRYPIDDLLLWLQNYFDDPAMAKRGYPWGIFASDPVGWKQTQNGKPPPKEPKWMK